MTDAATRPRGSGRSRCPRKIAEGSRPRGRIVALWFRGSRAGDLYRIRPVTDRAPRSRSSMPMRRPSKPVSSRSGPSCSISWIDPSDGPEPFASPAWWDVIPTSPLGLGRSPRDRPFRGFGSAQLSGIGARLARTTPVLVLCADLSTRTVRFGMVTSPCREPSHLSRHGWRTVPTARRPLRRPRHCRPAIALGRSETVRGALTKHAGQWRYPLTGSDRKASNCVRLL